MRKSNAFKSGARNHLPAALLALLLTLQAASAFYDPGLQRWINRDPISERGGINLFEFAANMPTDAVDALGLELTPLSPDIGNCYSYACNKGDGNGPFFPGHGSTEKDPPWEYNCSDLTKGVKHDHPEAKEPDAKGNCPPGLGKIALFVRPDGDFHFERQETDGSWTEKCGFHEPPKKHKGDPDKNPAYPNFCGFLCVDNKGGKGDQKP